MEEEEPAAAALSPLQVIMDGRGAASTSQLTETGMTTLMQSAANIVMFVCGALAILLTALALWELYKAEGPDNFGGRGAEKSSIMLKLMIAGLVSIPAIIAGILPHILL